MERNAEISYLRSREPLDVPYMTIPELIRHHAEKTPESIAQVCIDWETFERKTMTFNDLYTQATRVAKGLQRFGLRKGDFVAIGTDNCPEWMLSVIGVLMCGAVSIFFTFDRIDGEDVKSVLSKVGDKCKVFIFPKGKNDCYVPIVNKLFEQHQEKEKVTCEYAKSIEVAIAMTLETDSSFFCLDTLMNLDAFDGSFTNSSPEDIACIFMTSGSTGQPKLIPHSHLSIIGAGFHFSLGFPCWEIFSGGTRVYIKHPSFIPSIQQYLKIIHKSLQLEKCTGSLLITSILQEISQDRSLEWNLENVVAGGQPIPFSLVKSASSFCQNFVVVYGASEVFMLSFLVCAKNADYPDYIVGTPLPGVEIKVVDTDGNVLKRGERGEAYSRSSIPFNGYFGDSEKTSQVLTTGGWYKTDDSAIITIDGRLIIDGRMSDSLVKSTGTGFLSVAFAEGHLKQHPLVRDAAVLSLYDYNHFPCVCCAVILKDGAAVLENQMEEYLLDSKEHITSLYKQINVPKKFIFFEKFPKTYNGKVNRKELAYQCKGKFENFKKI
ncbi:hypothetical protein FSP39_008780 [Pinctada imbricata]|uniref:Uncharacterized protein n=1 Tax=Pinctada imbricata TaxID=66713 RepID=A0AA89C5N9_PINIB|nr:hypothetical protein FSP39_008780 [Pinctada imbricata]